METLKIKFSLKLIENNLSDNEKEPFFNVFLDRRFERKPVKINLNAKNVTVSGSIDSQNIPQTAALILSGFAHRYNKEGYRETLDIGMNHIFLKDILNKGSRKFKLPIHMNTIRGGVEKAKVRLTIHSVDSGNIQISNQVFNGRFMAEYINGTIAAESRMANTILGTENMRVPYDMSESGIELTGGVPLPALAYVDYETPKSNEKFWKNALKQVMNRDGYHESEFYKLDIEQQARVFAQIVCYCPQYLDYVADTVDLNKRGSKINYKLIQGCENFGDSLVTWSGDCEDLGTGILMCFDSFKSSVFTHPTLIKLQEIADQYLGLLSLDVVNGAQVVDKNSPKGAHMNVNLVPIHMFRKMTSKEFDSNVSHLYPDHLDERLPFMVGEGTGMLEPLGVKDLKTNLKAKIYGLPSLRGFKKPISRSRKDPGRFLVGSLNGFTNFFLKRGMAVGAMVYTTKHPDNSITRGAFYTDMINDSRDVGLLVHKPLGKNEMDIIKEAVMYRDPPHDLIITNEKAKKPNAHLEKISKKINKLGRSGTNNFVPIYVRPHQIDERVTRDIIRDLQRVSDVWKVEYSLEMVTDQVWGYEMKIYM